MTLLKVTQGEIGFSFNPVGCYSLLKVLWFVVFVFYYTDLHFKINGTSNRTLI